MTDTFMNGTFVAVEDIFESSSQFASSFWRCMRLLAVVDVCRFLVRRGGQERSTVLVYPKKLFLVVLLTMMIMYARRLQ